MANLPNNYGKKSGLYHRPEKKTRAVDTLVSNIVTLSAAKCEGIFRYILRVTLFAVRDKDEWRYLKYQIKYHIRILENMLPRNVSFPSDHSDNEHATARADPYCLFGDIPNWRGMSRGGFFSRLVRHFSSLGLQTLSNSPDHDSWKGR